MVFMGSLPSRPACDSLRTEADMNQTARRLVKETFDGIIRSLRRDPRFRDLSPFELDLILADYRPTAEQQIARALQMQMEMTDGPQIP